MSAPRLWFYAPFKCWMRWSPIWLGSDEWYRRTVVIGWAFTGQVVIALWQFPDDPDIKLCDECGLMLSINQDCDECGVPA